MNLAYIWKAKWEAEEKLGKCNQKNDQHVRFQRACWNYFFYYSKIWRYPFANVCVFFTFGIWQCLLFFKVTLESGIDVAPYTVQTYVVKFKSFKSVAPGKKSKK